MNDLDFPRRDRVHFLLKDPHWTFVWWDLMPATWDRARSDLGAEAEGARLTLRVYDVTGIAPNAGAAHRFFDVDASGSTDHWYLNIWDCDRNYCVDVGLKTAAGEFYPLARSNALDLPRDRPSDCTDGVWDTMYFEGMEG